MMRTPATVSTRWADSRLRLPHHLAQFFCEIRLNEQDASEKHRHDDPKAEVGHGLRLCRDACRSLLKSFESSPCHVNL